MTGVVVDASITAAWLLPDEANDLLWESTNSWPGATFTFQRHLRSSVVELRNPQHPDRQRATRARHATSGRCSTGFSGQSRADHGSRYNWNDAVDLARQFGLTTYDSAYLELALRRDLRLATLDKALINAATQIGRLAGRESIIP